MKKKYTKPMIIYDCFELSTSIAGNCEMQANFNYGACTASAGGINLFADGLMGSTSCAKLGGVPAICMALHRDLRNGKSACWENFTESNNVFSS